MSTETFISSRLTPAVRWTSADERAVCEIAQTDKTDSRGAPIYEWTLRFDGVTLETFSSFVDAWREAVEHIGGTSDNREMFTDACLPFVDYAEEFACDVMTDVEAEDTARADSHDLAICSDCLIWQANGDDSGFAEHDNADVVRNARAVIVDGSELGFSWSRCDLCNGLAGDRFAANEVER